MNIPIMDLDFFGIKNRMKNEEAGWTEMFIPALMVALNRTGLVRFHREQKVAVKEG